MIALAENRYGKSRVRLAKVKRHAAHHDFCEWTLEILLSGDFASCFVEGDNSNILPTDTMKNTVYSLARDSSAECMEEFGKELVKFFLQRNPQIFGAEIVMSENRWEHLLTAASLIQQPLCKPALSFRSPKLLESGMARRQFGQGLRISSL